MVSIPNLIYWTGVKYDIPQWGANSIALIRGFIVMLHVIAFDKF